MKLVALSVMSAADTLGHRDVHGLSATDSCPRQWISVCTMPKDIGMLSKPVLVTAPYMSMQGDNTTHISNDSVAQLGPMIISCELELRRGQKSGIYCRLCSVG